MQATHLNRTCFYERYYQMQELIILISRDALMFTSLVDYLQIYSACFDVTRLYDKCQGLCKYHPEDGPNYMCSGRWSAIDRQHFENTQ